MTPQEKRELSNFLIRVIKPEIPDFDTSVLNQEEQIRFKELLEKAGFHNIEKTFETLKECQNKKK